MTHDVRSPVTGESIARVNLASRSEIAEALDRLSGPARPLPAHEVFAFLERFRAQLVQQRELLFERTLLETGFIASDSLDIVNAAIEFLTDFETYIRDQTPRQHVVRHSYSAGSHREMRITDRPFGCIAAVVPQNASLTLSITIIASALYAGSRVLLRPSLQCASTGSLLREIVERSRPPRGYVETLNCLAADFIDVCCASEHVDVIHYIGSNQYALPVFRQAFAAGKTCLLDGQGNGLLYLDNTFPIPEAVRIITAGATRYNGETCTSINGALIHESVYDSVRDALVEAFERLRVGHPRDPKSQIGPLFSELQARALRDTLDETPGGRLLCGGDVRGAYFTPAILEGVEPRDQIARAGLFGPALWVRRVREEDVCRWLRGNQFPLSDTVLSMRRGTIRQIATSARAARICINEDPSIESMFEPWGGYPPSGLNPVSVWTEKYRQAFQLDGTLRDIVAAGSDSDERE